MKREQAHIPASALSDAPGFHMDDFFKFSLADFMKGCRLEVDPTVLHRKTRDFFQELFIVNQRFEIFKRLLRVACLEDHHILCEPAGAE
jgi:hypothetical protein